MKFINNIQSSISANKKAFLYAFDCAKKTDSGLFGKINTFLEKYKEKKAIIRVTKTDSFKVIPKHDSSINMTVMLASFAQKAAERDAKIAAEEQTTNQLPMTLAPAPLNE